MFSRQAVYSLTFVINSTILCVSSIAYCINWTDYSSPCGESQAVITVVCAMASIVYGGMVIGAVVIYAVKLAMMMSVCLTFSATGLVFSAVAGAGMLISLYFGYDPSCLADSKSKTDFVLLWVMAFYAVVSNAVFLVIGTYLSFKEDVKGPEKEAEKTPVV